MILPILARAGLDLAHGRDGLIDHDPRPFGLGLGAGDHVLGLLGAVCGPANGLGDLVQRCGGLFQAGGLLLGAARQIVGGDADLVGA